MVRTKKLTIYRDISECYEYFARQPILAIDLETTGLSPYRDNIAVVNIADRDGVCLVQHVWSDGWPSALSRLIAKPGIEWCTHNGTGFDWLMLRSAGFDWPQLSYDTLIGEQVLLYQDRHDVRRDLGSSMKRRLGRNIKKEMDHSGWTNRRLNEAQIDYCTHDVAYLLDLVDVQRHVAEQRKMTEALEFEQVVAVITGKAMWNGLALPYSGLQDRRNELARNAAAATKRVKQKWPNLNVNAPQQVKDTINREYDLGLTNAQAVTLLEYCEYYPLIEDIMTSKSALRRTGVYDDEWFEKFVIDERLHGVFWSLGANTGRFTSEKPNLQAIPRNMRCIIGNQPGRKVVQADYAQIEVRIMAFYARDKKLIDACTQDIHSRMARAMFDCPYGPVQPHLRSPVGKYGTFSWQFDGSYKAVQRSALKGGTRLDDATARKMIRLLDREFFATHQLHEQARKLIRRGTNQVDLPYGHRRQFRPGDLWVQKYLNTLVQGTAAVGFKEGMVEMDCRGLTDYLGGLVHDEIVCTGVPESDAPWFEAEMADSMRVGMERMMESVQRRYPRTEYIFPPIEVESKYGDFWK